MNDEIKVTKTENGYSYKIRTPLISDKELIQIDTFTSEIAKELNEKVLKEKDMIIAQRLIHNLQQRIDKAIEYLEDHTYDKNGECGYTPDWEVRELYDILKGTEDEEN